MMDLASIMRMLGHARVDVLKMDIEFSEWEVWKNWKDTSPSVLDRVGQLLAEVHFEGDTAENIPLLAWIRSQGMEVFSRRENFRYCRLKDLRTFSNKKNATVRAYHCIEVGWRRIANSEATGT